MTGTAVAFQKRCMANRIEQAFIRASVGIMTVVTGIGTWFDSLVKCNKIGACYGMAICTEQAAFFVDHSLLIRSMGLMTLEAVFGSGSVDHTFPPELGNVRMAGETDHWLRLFQYIVMGGTVCRMTGGAVFIHGRLMGVLGVLDNCVHITMTFKAEFSWFLLDNICKIGRVGRVTAVTLTLGHRGMGGDVLIRFLDGFVTGGTECSAFIISNQVFVLLCTMELVTATAVAGGKGLMETETAPFILFFFVTGEAEFRLRFHQQLGVP